MFCKCFATFLLRNGLCALHGIATESRPSVYLSLCLSVRDVDVYRGRICWVSSNVITYD